MSSNAMSSNAMSSNAMSADDSNRAYGKDLWLASALVTAGLVMSGMSLIVLIARHPQEMAQATPPLQSSPSPAPQASAPGESKPGGERPHTRAAPRPPPRRSPRAAGRQDSKRA